MIIPRERPYIVTVEETPDAGSKIIIQSAKLIIYATSIEEACHLARKYFGMGIDITIRECKMS